MLSPPKGCTAAIYGCAANDGAHFTVSILGGPTLACTAYKNTASEAKKSELCLVEGLDEDVTHTLLITHNDTADKWLNLDFLT